MLPCYNEVIKSLEGRWLCQTWILWELKFISSCEWCNRSSHSSIICKLQSSIRHDYSISAQEHHIPHSKRPIDRQLLLRILHGSTLQLFFWIVELYQLLIIAEIYFEQTYDTYFPGWGRTYLISEVGTMPGDDGNKSFNFAQTSGATAPGIKQYAPL